MQPEAFPYETRLNIRFQPLEIIDEKAIADSCPYKWFNQTLCQVNSSVVRMGVVEGEYHWHKHDTDDEFFYVIDGKFVIDLEGRRWNSRPGRALWFPEGSSTALGRPCEPSY
jgi:mannose-6-phosphate isomerase-like protein (cupin superfamily)